ncbi:hypothetical protein [Campylobacter troglodytis]|uniref:hypothetical protein n=1 Tax=Campylobacter troglodytis TaxID=654363 RepID=UPI001FEAC87D|nr:hypothetical protein [Campylobacter troglodytis]
MQKRYANVYTKVVKQCLDKELPSIIRDLIGLKESEICSDKLKAMMAWLIFYFARSLPLRSKGTLWGKA